MCLVHHAQLLGGVVEHLAAVLGDQHQILNTHEMCIRDRAEGLSLRDAVRQAARETGLAKNELYDRAVGKTGGCE